MLVDALFQIVGVAGVIAAVGAAQEVGGFDKFGMILRQAQDERGKRWGEALPAKRF